MSLFIIILLAIIQGFLEWIPVSSEAFLMIIMALLQYPLTYSFELVILLHISTATAALIYYRRKLWKSLRNARIIHINSDPLTRYIFWSTIFTGITGVPLYYLIKSLFSAMEKELLIGTLLLFILIGIAMIATATVISFAQRVHGNRKVENLRFRDYLLIGVLQGLAIIPGVSRSGITISVLLLYSRVDSKEAVDLSFMLSIPTIYLATLFELLAGSIKRPLITLSLQTFLLLVLTFLMALLGIRVMTKLASKVPFHIFLKVFGFMMLLLNASILIGFLLM